MSLFDRIFLSESSSESLDIGYRPCVVSATLVVLEGLERRPLDESGPGSRDLNTEHKLAKQIQRGKHPSNVIFKAREFDQRMADYKAGTRRTPPSVPATLKQVFDAARSERAARKQAKEIVRRESARKSREAKAAAAARNVPPLTDEQGDHADDLIDHASLFYSAQEARKNSQAHVDHLRKHDPAHKALPDREADLASHEDSLQRSHEALKAGMKKAGIHPAHANRVLQPSIHDINPHGRRHMDAVAHLMGGTKEDGGYAFPEGGVAHHQFHAWASMNHRERQPVVVGNQVVMKAGLPKSSDSGPSRDTLERHYPSTVRQKPKTQEEIAREHAKHHMDKMAEDPGHEQYLRSNDKFKHVGDGVHELRYWRTGEENDAALRVYTDNRGEFLDHSGKQGGEQKRRIARAKRRLRARNAERAKAAKQQDNQQEWSDILEWFLL